MPRAHDHIYLPELGPAIRSRSATSARAESSPGSSAASGPTSSTPTRPRRAFSAGPAALTVRPRPAIVHTFHGHVLEGYFGPAKSRAYRNLERFLARRSDVLIGVSQATVDDLVRLGVAPADRFQVVPLGLDLEPL